MHELQSARGERQENNTASVPLCIVQTKMSLKKEAAKAVLNFLLLHPNCQKDLRDTRSLQSKYLLLFDPYHIH